MNIRLCTRLLRTVKLNDQSIIPNRHVGTQSDGQSGAGTALVKGPDDKSLVTRITVEGPNDVSITSGIPDEHIYTRTVLIKKPTKNSMQSGTNNLQKWVMSFETRDRWENHLMGWTSSADPLSNMDVQFSTKEEAIAFCDKNRWAWKVQEPPQKTPAAKSYAANFSWNKRTRRSTK